jgi:integration host factor subunit alpha
MPLTKSKIIESIYNQCGFSKNRSTALMEAILETIKKSLVSGEDVLISGFGKFCVKEKGQRRGRNPQTGNDLMLGARKVVIFKCSKVLKNKINTERRRHPRISKRLPFRFKTQDFNILAETINLCCNGVYCTVNDPIPLMTKLKVVLALPCDEKGDEFDYLECDGIVVRVEQDKPEANKKSVNNIAIYFDGIGESDKRRLKSFLA